MIELAEFVLLVVIIIAIYDFIGAIFLGALILLSAGLTYSLIATGKPEAIAVAIIFDVPVALFIGGLFWWIWKGKE